MTYNDCMNYNREDFNRMLNQKIGRKLVATATILAGITLLDKLL